MCRVCDVQINQRKYIQDGDYVSIAVERWYEDEYYVVAVGDDFVRYRMYYCLECGRYLGGELDD